MVTAVVTKAPLLFCSFSGSLGTLITGSATCSWTHGGFETQTTTGVETAVVISDTDSFGAVFFNELLISRLITSAFDKLSDRFRLSGSSFFERETSALLILSLTSTGGVTLDDLPTLAAAIFVATNFVDPGRSTGLTGVHDCNKESLSFVLETGAARKLFKLGIVFDDTEVL